MLLQKRLQIRLQRRQQLLKGHVVQRILGAYAPENPHHGFVEFRLAQHALVEGTVVLQIGGERLPVLQDGEHELLGEFLRGFCGVISSYSGSLFQKGA